MLPSLSYVKKKNEHKSSKKKKVKNFKLCNFVYY